jgi:hypothetical protein
MYASTWGMAERICRDDKDPVASFGDFGDLGIQHSILWGFSKHWCTQNLKTQQFFLTGIYKNLKPNESRRRR